MLFSQSLRAHFVLSALVALPFASAVHVIFGGTRPVVTTRLDPIVNPGALGTHMHTIAGGNGFKNTYSYDDLTTSSTCTTIVIPQDHSNYWTPSFYHHDPTNGSFSLMPASFNIYYLVRGQETGDTIIAPPKGLVMLAGDPNRRVNNATNHADQAISFVCLDYSGSHNGDPDWAERPDFFDHNCPDGMRAQVFFPSCWDGQNLDSADHKSHMSYPVENYNDGHCPPTHPVHIISIFYEMLVSTDQYEYHGEGTWVLANGDVTGRGFHGDFAMGWTDPGLITSLINDCPNAAGNVADCPALNAVMDSNAAAACRFDGQIVDEPIGDQAPLAALPGCNPIWEGTGPKPTCPNGTPTPPMVGTQQSLLAGWTDIGCIAEGTNGRALTGASTVDTVAMTPNACATYCGNKGYQYAGIEWSQECYCGNTLSNGASTNTVSADQCSNACTGDQFMTCGGPQRLTLLHNPNPGQTPVSSAAPLPSSVVPPVMSSSVAPSKTLTVVPSPSSSVLSSSVASVISSSATSVAPSSAAPVHSSSVASVPSSSAVPTPSSSTVPASSAAAPAPPVNTPVSPAPAPGTWTAAGCVADGASRTLSGLSTASDQMTVPMCQSLCDAKGFTLAGLEFGRECYCGNGFSNNGGATLPSSQCYMTCSDGQKCGGTWAISLFKKTSGSPAAPASTAPATPSAPSGSAPASGSGAMPSGWSTAGCGSDGSQRALTGYSFTSTQMTQALCVSTCANKGFTIAGVEYASECYCGNSFQNGLGKALPSNQCYMHTPNGDLGGGTWAMTLFKANAQTKRSPKAKHFGRNIATHGHTF